MLPPSTSRRRWLWYTGPLLLAPFLLGFVMIRMGWLEVHALSRWSGCPVSGSSSAQAYYAKGVSQKARGWIEAARTCMEKAIEADGDGAVADRARSFVRSRLPRQEVSVGAETRNIRAYNAWRKGDLSGAIDGFTSLIEDYPDFEWPCSNLGALYLEEGQPARAEPLLRRALELNPRYINALVHLGRLHAKAGRLDEAEALALRALTEDPVDEGARQLIQTVTTAPSGGEPTLPSTRRRAGETAP